MKPLPAHSIGTVLAYEWYCIVRTLSIPALLNGFDHWFRFSYMVLVESVSLPPFWTPWFFWLTCLEAAMEMSCCPSHGLDPTFTSIDNKKEKKIHLKMGCNGLSSASYFSPNHRKLPIYYKSAVVRHFAVLLYCLIRFQKSNIRGDKHNVLNRNRT